MRVGIVGAGVMGTSLGYFLARQGVDVEIWEASPGLAGLAGSMLLEDGTEVDRFYHALLTSDSHVIDLCRELGIDDHLRFRETRMGFYEQGALYSMNGMVDFLRFPPLGWIDRFRLGLTVLYAQLVSDWQKLEDVGVRDWLTRLGGRRTFLKIWRPLLRAKFDGDFDDMPATYIWARLVRIKSTRSGASQKEQAGHLVGGYGTLVRAMAERITACGGQIHLACPVDSIWLDAAGSRALGLRVDGREIPYDSVVATLQVPYFRNLIPAAPAAYHDLLAKTGYLGIICPLLVLDRPLTGYWTLNITDETVPFTGIIETTTYIDPAGVGGHHLVYLPKYTAPGSHWLEKSDDEIETLWLSHLAAMFPTFDPSWIRQFVVQRACYVEPLHARGATHLIPPIETPIDNLYLATTAQIYPRLTNTESVSRHAAGVSATIVKRNGGGT